MSAADAAAAMLAGFAAGDLDAALDALDPELVLVQSSAVPWGGTYHGPAGFQEFVGKMLALVEVAIVDQQIHDAGDVAVGRILTRFTERASGRSVEFPVVELYWARDGRLSRIEPYYQDQVALNGLFAG